MIDIVVENNWEGDLDYLDFVLNKSENGTVFHLPEFLNYHKSSFFVATEKYLIKFFKNNKIIAGIIGGIKQDQTIIQFISPYGASYGGLVTSKGLGFHEYEAIYEMLISFLKNIVEEIKITPVTAIHYAGTNSSYAEFILLSKGFQIIKADLLLVHMLDNPEFLMSRMDKKTATELKQPLKSNNLSISLISGIDIESYNLLMESQRRLDSSPTHTLEEINQIENLVPGTVNTFKVINENKMVAGIVTFSVSKEVLNTFYIFDDASARELKANHFSYYNVLKWAGEKNYRYLDFGPSSFGFIPNYPLIRFKEKFDAKPFIRSTYKLSFAD